jgi:hypothetical protein
LNRHNEDQAQRQEFEKVVNWLSTADYSKKQNDSYSRRQPGTGEWLLNSAKFQAWLTSESQTLFCPGIPGAGKIILASIVIDHLLNKMAPDTGVGVAYIYVGYNQPQEQQQPVNVLRGLLKQLLENSPCATIPESVQELYELPNRRRSNRSLREVVTVLQGIVQSFTRVFLLVDGLDEYHTPYDRDVFLSEIFNMQASSKLSLFATSREIPEIRERFVTHGSAIQTIRATSQDLQAYIRGYLPRIPSLRRYADLEKEIEAAVLESVDGMYVFTH